MLPREVKSSDCKFKSWSLAVGLKKIKSRSLFVNLAHILYPFDLLSQTIPFKRKLSEPINMARSNPTGGELAAEGYTEIL